MTGSNLVTHKLPLARGFTAGRSGQKICKITPHQVVGNLTVHTIQKVLSDAGISSTYSIQDVNLAQHICESNRPHTSSSALNDNQAITVEIANDESVMVRQGNNTHNGVVETLTQRGNRLGWPISKASMDTFIKLCIDIMRRYNFPPLVVGENLTWHSMFKATNCPGPYIMSQLQYIADTCNNAVFPPMVIVPGTVLYGVAKQVVALSDKGNAERHARELNALSPDLNKEYYKVIEIQR